MMRVRRPIQAATEYFTFKVPVKWKMRTIMKIPARSLKEAIQIVNSQEHDLPEGEYIDDSFEIDYDRLED